MAVGSVIPSDDYSCIRNVTFTNHRYDHPAKVIYIKTSEGSTTSGEPGSGGIISDITYDQIYSKGAFFWPIYIGPEQKKGCMLYPLWKCETQPLISIENITLRDVQTSESLSPGVVRCSDKNPCKNISWNYVNGHGWWHFIGLNYFTENVNGSVEGSKPIPVFNKTSDEDANLDAKFDIYVELMKHISKFIEKFFHKDQEDKNGLETVVQAYGQIYKSFTQ